MEGKKKEKKNTAKFSGHYVRPHTQNVRAHALRSHQLKPYFCCFNVLVRVNLIYTPNFTFLSAIWKCPTSLSGCCFAQGGWVYGVKSNFNDQLLPKLIIYTPFVVQKDQFGSKMCFDHIWENNTICYEWILIDLLFQLCYVDSSSYLLIHKIQLILFVP